MKKAKNSSGGEYQCKYDWDEDCFVQCGGKGIVLSTKGNYQTAFFEAFPTSPNTFIRGEGKDIEEAEGKAWEKLQKYKNCSGPNGHEFERRNYTNGAGVCKYCGLFKGEAFEPLTKCCICGKPTYFTKDSDEKWYCKEHSQDIPIDRIPEYMWSSFADDLRQNLDSQEKLDKLKSLMRKNEEKFGDFYYSKGFWDKVNFSEKILKRKICNDIFICSDLTFNIISFKHYRKNIRFEDCFLVKSLKNEEGKYHLLIFSNVIKDEAELDKGKINESNNKYIKTGFLLKEEDFKQQEDMEDMLKKVIERMVV